MTLDTKNLSTHLLEEIHSEPQRRDTPYRQVMSNLRHTPGVNKRSLGILERALQETRAGQRIIGELTRNPESRPTIKAYLCQTIGLPADHEVPTKDGYEPNRKTIRSFDEFSRRMKRLLR